MGRFRHHKYFAKAEAEQRYRFPFVCVECRKSYKYPATVDERHCPQCGKATVRLSRKFAAPPARDRAQWKTIAFLIGHGFRYYPVYEASCGGMVRGVKYPRTLKEAEVFVQVFAPRQKSAVLT